MKISVTQKNIDDFDRFSRRALSCPVHNAIKEAGYDNTCGIDAVSIDFPDGTSTLIPLPEIAMEAIKKFDTEGVMEPFSFELPL